MADAIISRGNTSVTIPLLEEPQTLTVGRDIGKPNLKTFAVGREDPVIMDSLSATDNWTITGLLSGANAYSDAKTLAEDIIKPRFSSALELDLSSLPSKSKYDVVPATGSALALSYRPGERNLVGVQLSLAGVDEAIGGPQQSQTYPSPDNGQGVKIDLSGTSVTLTSDLTVKRTVGRPDVKLQPNPSSLPIGVDRNKPATDTFEISGRLTGNSAESNAQTLEEDILRKDLGSGGLTLHFQSGLFGLDAYPVAPTGSQAGRTTFSTAQTGEVNVPKLNLRVISAR